MSDNDVLKAVGATPIERPPTKLGMSMLEFFEWSATLNIKNLSPAQKITLKVIQGEPLDETTPIPISHPFQDKAFESEVEMFKFFSGKDHYEPTVYSDVSLAWGRRSGKSTTIGAGIAVYFATQFDYTPYLGTSPHATIPIVSPTKEQAGEIYATIKNMMLRSTYLFDEFLDGKIDNFQDEYDEEKVGKKDALIGGQIKLNNKIIIKVIAADISKLRGMAVPFAIMDEACFMGVMEGTDAKNTDKAIYEAI